MSLQGRSCRLYIVGPIHDREFEMVVSYHRKGRRMTCSPKLMKKVLR